MICLNDAARPFADAARDLLEREGVGGFTMERVADEAVSYACSAIYRFFPF